LTKFTKENLLLLSCGHASDDVTVTSIGDGQGADAEVFTASGSKLDVVACVVVNSCLGKHGVVLDLGPPSNYFHLFLDFSMFKFPNGSSHTFLL